MTGRSGFAASALIVGGSLWHYRRHETPGRGRVILAVLRAAVEDVFERKSVVESNQPIHQGV